VHTCDLIESLCKDSFFERISIDECDIVWDHARTSAWIFEIISLPEFWTDWNRIDGLDFFCITECLHPELSMLYTAIEKLFFFFKFFLSRSRKKSGSKEKIDLIGTSKVGIEFCDRLENPMRKVEVFPISCIISDKLDKLNPHRISIGIVMSYIDHLDRIC
jgi:hypothetical protein